MSAPIPTSEPRQIRAGDTVQWTIDRLTDYLPADGWSLTYYIAGAGGILTQAATVDDTGYAVTLTAAQTGALLPGDYAIEGKVSMGAYVFTVYSSRLCVLVNLATATTSTDTRSYNRRVRDALRALTEDELDECPVFTDEGDDRNIIWEGEDGEEKTTLTRSRISDLDLPNRVECVFDDNEQGSLEVPVRPVEDVDAQLRAGRVVGDKSRKVNVKKYPLLGVSVEEQAVKMAWSLLDLGPFDEGGLQNNLSIKFKIWYLDSLDLHPFKVIKVTSSQLTRYGFQYFRVMKMNRAENLIVELECQAYNETYMAAFETNFEDIIVDPPAGDIDPWQPPELDPPICELDFGTVTYENGILKVPIQAC